MKKSILAGILISLGCITYLNCSNPIVGSLLFSLGLLGVCAFKLNLYTGKVGYASSCKSTPTLALIFLGNAIGCFIMALISCAIVDIEKVNSLVQAKLQIPIQLFFLKGIICGALMFIGVHAYNEKQLWPVTILCVMAFILGGAEHSVADTYYFIVGENIKDGITRVASAIIGNAVGAIACYRLTKG